MNLASVIRGFKAGVKTWATKNNINFEWQPRFYDHIVRDEDDLNRIKDYIINNPIKWNEDEYYSR
jgi:putative transposase